MIIEVFGLFLLVCFILIFLGFYTQIKVIALISFVGIFLLGLVLQGGHVNYVYGATQTNSYMCTICNTPSTNVTSCVGTPDNCIDHASIGICTLYGGCSWNGTDCIGTPFTCDTYAVREDCILNGCEYESTFTNGTAGINASVVASSTISYNNTSITDTTSKWLGRWLAFAGALGFILTIISNKNSDVKK